MPRAPKTPGATPSENSMADDLAGFEEGGALPEADPVQAQMAELKAEINRLKRREPEQMKATAQEPEMTEAEAERALAEQVAQGVRPRAILTPSGWMTHREMARQPGSLGNKV